MHESPVRFLPKSSDRKLSPVELVPYGKKSLRPSPLARAPFCSSTYVSIAATCPDSCAFKKGACYVRAGFTKLLSDRLDASAGQLTGDQVAVIEAAHIEQSFGAKGVPQDGARGGRDLRLHVGGDTPSAFAAEQLAKAADDYKRRGGGTVWTYTHNWRSIPRSAFGGISVLASVETLVDAGVALANGYAPALVVERHAAHRSWVYVGLDGTANPMRIIPCPAETGKTTCVQCRLCLDRDLVKMRAVIAFAVHGRGKAKVSLPMVR